MKKLSQNIMAFIAILCLFTGCTKISSGDKKKPLQGYYEVAIEGSLNLQLNMQGSCTNVFATYADYSNQGLPETKSLTIQGTDDKHRLISILLYFKSLPLDGKFQLGIDDVNDTYSGMGSYVPDATNINGTFYSTDDRNTGTCTITDYNQTSQTISGTFEFTGQGYSFGGATQAGVTASFRGKFTDVPINDATDPANPKGICYGTDGSALGTGGASGGGGNSGGGNNGGGGNNTSTITFSNPAFTPISITFNGESKTAPVGGNAVFTGTPNTTKTGNARTSGKTNTGTQIGGLISWDNISQSFPAAGTNKLVPLNIGSNFFFLKMVNKSALSIKKVLVNYGLQNQTTDNINIPNDGLTYNTGYYNAYSNSNVRAENGNTYWSWSTLSLPFTVNQVKTVQAN